MGAGAGLTCNAIGNVFTLTKVGTPTGTFTLTYTAQTTISGLRTLTTAAIDHAASASDVKTALELLGNVAPGNVVAATSNGWTITLPRPCFWSTLPFTDMNTPADAISIKHDGDTLSAMKIANGQAYVNQKFRIMIRSTGPNTGQAQASGEAMGRAIIDAIPTILGNSVIDGATTMIIGGIFLDGFTVMDIGPSPSNPQEYGHAISGTSVITAQATA